MRGALRVVAGALVASGAALAQTEKLVLTWDGPPECPGREAVRARISSLLGADVESFARDVVTVSGRVVVTSAGAELHLETAVPSDQGRTASDGSTVLHGERTLRGATCEEVTGAGALVIALAIDPKAVEATSLRGPVAAFSTPPPASAAPSAAAAPTPSAAPPPPPPIDANTPPAERSPRSEAEARTEGRIDARVVMDLGALPGPSIGAGLGAGFSLGRFTARFEGSYFFLRFAKASTPAPDGGERGADVSLVTFDVDGCYAVVPGAVELDVCAIVEPGALLAVGSGLQRNTSAIKPWIALGGSTEILVKRWSPLTLRAGVGALVPLGRSHVRFTETDETSSTLVDLDRPAIVSGRAFLGAGLSF